MSDTTRRVTVSRRIEAPLDVVFGIISDPRQHANFDGSGMVIEADASASSPIGSVGCVFRMNMHNDEMGNYGMDNTVVEFEPGRRIIWQPKLAWATRRKTLPRWATAPCSFGAMRSKRTVRRPRSSLKSSIARSRLTGWVRL